MIYQAIPNEQIISRFVEPAMFVALLVILFFFGVISFTLNYHWTRYGIDTKKLAQIRRIYFGISTILFLAMITFLILALR